MIRNSLFIVAILCLTMPMVSKAQQDPLYSQYMFNMMSINPAYAGSRELLSVSAIGRSQWTGIKGAPQTAALIGDFSLKEKKIGLGAQVFDDKIGITKNTGITISYAYRLRFKRGVFSMGLQGGISMFRANYADVQLSSSDNPDVAFSQNVNEFKPAFGAGIYYNSDRYYIGFSAPHLLNTNPYRSTTTQEGAYYSNHWFLTAGYVFDLTSDLALKPSFLLRMVRGAPLNADINANLWFYKLVAIGASYRTSKMIVGMIEIQINRQFRFGYAYDYTTSGLTNRGSHELLLRYEFGFEKKRMVSPRYF